VPASQAELEIDDSFSLPSGVSTEDALRALASLPSWQLLSRANLEPGSSLLVTGDWPAVRVLECSKLLGCTWRASWGVKEGAAEEIRILAAEQPLTAVRSRKLPTRPDVVILTSVDALLLTGACSVCRDRGTIVIRTRREEPPFDFGLYPEVHRRGLALAFVEGLPRPDRDAAAQLEHLIDRERTERRRP
jgi:hypothetical protein